LNGTVYLIVLMCRLRNYSLTHTAAIKKIANICINSNNVNTCTLIVCPQFTKLSWNWIHTAANVVSLQKMYGSLRSCFLCFHLFIYFILL